MALKEAYTVWMSRHKDLKLISRALKDYDSTHSNPIPAFEKDYGCKIKLDGGGNIIGVSFINKGAESMFHLKYGNK